MLRRLGERGDIIRTMRRAFGQQRRDLAIFDPRSAPAPIIGRIAAKGVADEHSAATSIPTPYLVQPDPALAKQQYPDTARTSSKIQVDTPG